MARLWIVALAAVVGCAQPASHRSLELTPCAIDALAEEAQCGVLDVLEDAANSESRRITLHVAVLPAQSDAPAPDPLFVFAGGPGQGARSYAAFFSRTFRAIRHERDLVFLDFRGTGDSAPLRCRHPRDNESESMLWRATAWQTDEPMPRDLRDELQRRVLSSQRRWRIAALTEIVIGTIGVLVTGLVAWYATALTERLAMSLLALVIIGVSVLAWRFRRSTSEPADTTTDAWVAFLITRARVRERLANAGALMLIVEIALYIPWIWARAAGSSVVPGFALLALISVVLAVWLCQQRRSARRDIAQLSKLQHELR